MKRPEGFDQPKAKPPAQREPGRVTSLIPKPAAPPRAGLSRKKVRAAAIERKRYERGEVRRFTRGARVRRRILAGVVFTVVSLFAAVTVAVYSPLLSLESITIAGTSQLEAAEVLDAVDGQLGTPLALVDFDQVTRELSEFALIRSFTTESVPPHSLVITIVERQPLGVVADGSSFAVVDPAGVVLDSVRERPAGVPLVDAGEASIGNPAFRSAVEVLLALPPGLLARVDTTMASTEDDVTLSLVGGTQSVRWGSADRSDFKARVLAALVATQNQSANLEYDVSAPDAPVIRPR